MDSHYVELKAMMEAFLETPETNQEKLEAEMEANQEKTEARAKHYNLAPCIRALHLVAVPQGRASDVPYMAPK
jgi:hypothetical protein